MAPRGRTIAAAFALGLVLATPRASSAQGAAVPPAAEQASKAYFEEGRALLAAGRPADAIPKLLKSLDAMPTPGTLLVLADAYERVGKRASAHARFREVEALTSAPTQAAEGKKRADALEPQLAKLTLRPPSRAGSVRSVTLDGREVPPASFGKPLFQDPGALDLVITDDQGGKTVRVVEVPEKGVVEVSLDPDPRETPAPPAPLAPVPAEGGSSTTRTIGFVAIGVGAGALVGGGIFGAFALRTKNDLEATCPTYPTCSSSRRDEAVALDDRASSQATLATVLLVAGAALVVTGVTLWVVSPSNGPTRRARAPGLGFAF